MLRNPSKALYSEVLLCAVVSKINDVSPRRISTDVLPKQLRCRDRQVIERLDRQRRRVHLRVAPHSINQPDLLSLSIQTRLLVSKRHVTRVNVFVVCRRSRENEYLGWSAGRKTLHCLIGWTGWIGLIVGLIGEWTEMDQILLIGLIGLDWICLTGWIGLD